MAQMKVLSAARKQAFNSVPKLTREATLGYFTLDLETKKILRKNAIGCGESGFSRFKGLFSSERTVF